LVDTWANNIRARKFHEKLGFQQYGVLPNGLVNREGDGYVDEIFYYYNLT
jgi:RimJ/RimL family protein N-acetyltransferase